MFVPSNNEENYEDLYGHLDEDNQQRLSKFNAAAHARTTTDEHNTATVGGPPETFPPPPGRNVQDPTDLYIPSQPTTSSSSVLTSHRNATAAETASTITTTTTSSSSSTTGGHLLLPSSGFTSSSTTTTTSSAKVLNQLLIALYNERYSPTIMPYPSELINAIVPIIAAKSAEAETEEQKFHAELEVERRRVQQGQLAANESEGTLSKVLLYWEIVRIDAQRAQFVLTELLRIRIRKIEQLALTIVSNSRDYFSPTTAPGSGGNSIIRGGEEAAHWASSALPTTTNILSQNEFLVAESFAKMQQQLALSQGLQHVPEPLQKLTPNLPHAEGVEILPKPLLDKFVFVLFLEDLGNLVIDERTNLEAKKGHTVLMRYRDIAPYILDGRARLL